MRRLGALLGEPVDAAPEFALAMDLAAGYGQSLRALRCCSPPRISSEQPPWNPDPISGLEEFIISQLLMSHPHSFTAALRRAERPIAPRDVKRAIDFMEAMLRAPIANCGRLRRRPAIAGRTLFKHFQRLPRHLADAVPAQRALRQGSRDALRRARAGREHHRDRDGLGLQSYGPLFGRISQSFRGAAVGNPQACPLTFTNRLPSTRPSGRERGAGRPVDDGWFGWLLDAGLKIRCRKPEFLLDFVYCRLEISISAGCRVDLACVRAPMIFTINNCSIDTAAYEIRRTVGSYRSSRRSSICW